MSGKSSKSRVLLSTTLGLGSSITGDTIALAVVAVEVDIIGSSITGDDIKLSSCCLLFCKIFLKSLAAASDL